MPLKLRIIDEEVDQSWPVIKIAKKRTPNTWEKVFESAEPDLEHVSNILDEQEEKFGTYFPLKKDIFNAFHYTRLEDVKVVIVGQDPYHQFVKIHDKHVPRAQGMSFSVDPNDEIPSSLKNIFIELNNSIHGFEIPNNGCLTPWAQQGVLLLNNCLSVRANKAGSHGVIWHGFIKKVFKAISEINPKCIYLLWGRNAQSIKDMLGDGSIIFESPHPSGRSAFKGFFGCNHFKLVNETLIKQNKEAINWKIPNI